MTKPPTTQHLKGGPWSEGLYDHTQPYYGQRAALKTKDDSEWFDLSTGFRTTSRLLQKIGAP